MGGVVHGRRWRWRCRREAPPRPGRRRVGLSQGASIPHTRAFPRRECETRRPGPGSRASSQIRSRPVLGRAGSRGGPSPVEVSPILRQGTARIFLKHSRGAGACRRMPRRRAATARLAPRGTGRARRRRRTGTPGRSSTSRGPPTNTSPVWRLLCLELGPPSHQDDSGECVAEVKTQTKSYTRLPWTSRQPQLPQDGRIASLQRLLDGRRADAARDGLERRPRQRHQVGARPVVLGAPGA